jgi:anti-sigma factor RsiW
MRHPRVRCVEFVELVTDWSEGALDDDVRVEVEEHISLCPDCLAYLDQLRATSRLVHDLPAEPVPDASRDALLAMFRARHDS